MSASQVSFPEQERLAMELFHADESAALGASIAFLLHCVEAHPEMLQRVLRASVKRGHVQLAPHSYRLIDVLKDIAK